MTATMHVTSDIQELRDAVKAARDSRQRIGCVPTMGALHAGHVSLFHVCRAHAGFVVATIFVNPTQFAPHEDFSKYPRPLEKDLEAARQAGVDLVFTPEKDSLYPADYSTYVTVEGVSAPMEGAIRPTHFRGVATIVLKLFNIVQPDVAVFGAKDYQQQALIRRMVKDLDVPTDIITAPTMREADGLAMSSRNVYLSPEQRKSAIALWETLNLAEDRLHEGDKDIASVTAAMLDHLRKANGVIPDYAVIADPSTLAELKTPQPRMVALVAAKLGPTRLLDNKEINLP
jgi:pantoate--beta-alanine ligase